ncbi:probable disease resistance protein At5g66890 isoform X2 [Quercus suber]|uniref:probable disease resistance protein At5g66890 isoform X2 n=1 Tax=Quercus suber TaxID=58331 RepID=UPI0032DE33B4
MALIVAGPLLGVAFGQVFTSLRETVKDTVSKVCQFKPILERLQSTLDRLAPMVDQMVELSEKLDLPERETKRLKEHMEEGVKLVRKCLTVRWWNYVFKFKYSSKLKDLDDEIIREIPRPVSCAVRERTEFTVGLDMTIRELKTLLLKEKVRLLLLTAPGGCGKTKLVEMLCQDEQIKVSKTPNVKVIVQNLFSHKGLQPKFEIQSEENAIDQLLQLLENIGPDPILLILDDVWQESLPEKFEFNIPNYKIIATSRIAFPRFKNFRYNLKPLNKKDAMTLFCHSAELQDESSNIPEKDIKKIVRGCGGFPLALKVIGSSLRGRCAEEWRSRLLKWPNSQFFRNSEIGLVDQLLKSLEFPNDKFFIKDCFMDLGLFPEDQRIYAAALIDMWAELYELDEDGIHAIANLQELTTLNLASLVLARKDASEVHKYYNDDFVTQHDVLRELALHQSSQEPIGQRQRLIMNISENDLPNWWREQKHQLINARLLSISTDESFSWSWCNIQAPKVEVLVLNFQTKNYTLPEFVDKMDELKVLIVTNYGFFHAELSNFQLLGSLHNLKRIRLVKVSISSLCKTLVPLKSLKKISLFMCNIGKALENCTIQVSDALPNLSEINIDYCNDLEELPVGLCDIVHLKKLNITNCHKLFALPKEIGKLVNLEVLRFRSCTDLSELPESIKCLNKLTILDISDCLSISKLPKHIGELCKLEVLNMKGCLRLRNPFPESVMNLQQLKVVVCDDERAKLWEPIKEFFTKLEVKVAEKDINLNWLPDVDETV